MGRSLFEKNVQVDKYNKLQKFRTLATKLEMFFDASCHVVSMCKILLSLIE